jgi:hypothetical protein
MPGGRPRKHRSPVDMQRLIDAYFEHCDEIDEPYTITGLALSLDMTRTGLLDYERRGEFADTVKRAKARVEHSVEVGALRHGRAGHIFALKNYGWTDRQEIQQTSDTTLTIKWESED